MLHKLLYTYKTYKINIPRFIVIIRSWACLVMSSQLSDRTQCLVAIPTTVHQKAVIDFILGAGWVQYIVPIPEKQGTCHNG